MKDIRQPIPSMSSEEDDYIPNQKLSSRMLSRHPNRNQEWKEGHDSQAGHVHGQGGAQVQGVAHQHGQGDGDCGENRGARRSQADLPPLPSSSSSSEGSTSSSPPSSPTTGTTTPGRRPPRVVATPLWKRKSLSRMSSSARSQRAPMRSRLSQSQTKRQDQELFQSHRSSSSPTTPTCMQERSHIPVEAGPGSSKEPPIMYNILNPYNHMQSADTPAGKPPAY